MFKRLFCFVGLSSVIFAGCANVNPLVNPTGILYVVDRVNKAVFVFKDLGTIDGAQNPVRTLKGDLTLLDQPVAAAVDSRRDILYVADSGSDQILAFIPGSENDGNTAPRRTYPGPTDAGMMFYDIINDNLYVIDLLANTVLVWDNISQLDDGTVPSRIITLDYEPSALFLDEQRNQLYLADPDPNVINVYNDASTLDTTTAPPVDRTILEASPSPSPFPNTNFDNLDGITMNVQNNILYVADSINPSIEIFDRASFIDASRFGPVRPDRELFGDMTALTLDLGQIIFLENVLYTVLSRTNVGIWDNANTVDGNVAPNRNIQVVGATEILSIAVDLNH